MRALLDYCAFTVPVGVEPSAVLESLGGGEGFVALEHGAYGYKSALKKGNVTVLHDGTDKMGVHVVATGQGCRELEGSGVVTDWGASLAVWEGLGANFTRLDAALDDRGGVLKLDAVAAAVEQGRVVSRWRKSRTVQERNIRTGEIGGHTVYFGSRSSEKMLRFYDKGKQLGTGESYVRMELETKGTQAQALAALLIAGGDVGEVIAGVVRAMIDFKQAGTHSQRERWESCAWWSTFLGQVEKLRLSMAPAVRKIEQVYAWVQKQVAPMLAVLFEFSARGGHFDFYALLDDGQSRWGPGHRALLAGV